MRGHRLFPVALGLLLLGLGCSGTNHSSDRAGTANGQMTIHPQAPWVVVGQTVQFTASTPWGNEALWSVLPASAGTISPAGLFTASTTPATATVYAVWAKDVRYTASTPVRVLLPAPPLRISPDLVQASGGQQTAPGSAISNAAVVGEAVPAVTSTSAGGTTQVRHGFHPPVK